MGDGSIDLDERLNRFERNQDRIEQKLDQNLERDHNLAVRVTRLETQFKYWVGVATFIGGIVTQIINFILNHIGK